MIGSHFDADVSKATCRLACYGRLAAIIDADKAGELAKLRVYRLKQKQGSIDRVAKDGQSAVCKGMFKKETDISLFAGMRVPRDKLMLLAAGSEVTCQSSGPYNPSAHTTW